MSKHDKNGFALVPTRRVGMQFAPRCGEYEREFGSHTRPPIRDAARPGLHSHATLIERLWFVMAGIVLGALAGMAVLRAYYLKRLRGLRI